jgi:hypothetical protein
MAMSSEVDFVSDGCRSRPSREPGLPELPAETNEGLRLSSQVLRSRNCEVAIQSGITRFRE